MIEASDLYAMRGLFVYSLITLFLGGIIGWLCKSTITGMLTGLALCVPVTLLIVLGTLIFAPPDPGPHSLDYYFKASIYLIIPYFVFFLPPSFLGTLCSMFLHRKLRLHSKNKQQDAL